MKMAFEKRRDLYWVCSLGRCFILFLRALLCTRLRISYHIMYITVCTVHTARTTLGVNKPNQKVSMLIAFALPFHPSIHPLHQPSVTLKSQVPSSKS